MKILKEGTPIILNGECGACHSEIETDTKEAQSFKIPVCGGYKIGFEVKCPVCGNLTTVGFQRLQRRIVPTGTNGN